MENACDLSKRVCIPCAGGVPLLGPLVREALLDQLDDGWYIVDEHHLRRAYDFPDFLGALAFVNQVGEVAEAVGHHPELQLGWGHATVEIWTHAINGLSEADFILAAKIDNLSP